MSMAHESITTVLSVVAWGTNLTFRLYDFAVTNAFAATCGDVNKLAKEVNLLSQVLRQVGSTLKEDRQLPSQNAFDTVRSILDQCQVVFREIEIVVPLGPSRQNSQDASPVAGAGPVSPWREEVEWNALSQARTTYLLAHLESIKFTMSVMLQTLYTAKSIIWSKYDNTETAYEAVVVEKSQAEILVVEQQLAMLRAYRLYEAFKRQAANAPLPLNQSPHSQTLLRQDELGLSPRALVVFQEATLAQSRPSSNEIEDLRMVYQISSSYVDVLLSRWTQINAIEKRLQLDQHPYNGIAAQKYERRNWQAPAVEDDVEHETSDLHNPPKLRLTTDDPVLMPINDQNTSTSPISAAPRSTSLQPPGGPFSPQPSHSWGPTSGGYFPLNVANAAHRRVSPAPSPLSSPRASFSGDFAQDRSATAFRSDQSHSSAPSSPPPAPQPTAPQQRQPIPYRLRINQWYWDYHDDKLVSSNQEMSPQRAIKTVSKDTMAITEIFQEHVSREAIRERGYEYTRVIRERVVNGQKREEQCYCIEGALRPEQVLRLVDITERIRNPRSSTSKTQRSARQSKDAFAPPPLDRSKTAPVYGNKFREAHPSAREYDTARDQHKASMSNTSDEDGSYRTSSSVTRSKSKTRKDGKADGYADRSSSRSRSTRDKEKEKGWRNSISGGGKTQTLTKIAAGAGLATLLDGLPEMLAYL